MIPSAMGLFHGSGGSLCVGLFHPRARWDMGPVVGKVAPIVKKVGPLVKKVARDLKVILSAHAVQKHARAVILSAHWFRSTLEQ